jgi:hypothetical protein
MIPKEELTLLTSQKEILAQYPFMLKIPLCDLTPETVLASCLKGEYLTYAFKLEGVCVGILIVRDMRPTMFIVGHYAKGLMSKFDMPLYYENLKKDGYTKAQCVSNIDSDKVEKWSGMTKQFAMFEKEL